MKTIIHVISAVVLASTLAAHGETHFAGATYEVEIVRNNSRATSAVCMNFHQSGRLTMSNEALTMLWAPRDNFPGQFMAVTAPGERSVVPYHFGVHGTLHPDKTLTGRGIDQNGNTFVFRGRASGNCGGDLPKRAASGSIQPIINPTRSHKDDPCWAPPGSHVPCDPIPNPLRTANPYAQELIFTPDPCWFANGSQVPCDPIPNPLRATNPYTQELVFSPDPCWFANGSQVPCDPIPYPLSEDAESATTATLAGRSFRLTLGTTDDSVLEYCWTFGESNEIKTTQSKVLRWASIGRANGLASFQSVGAGADGRGMAYHGGLVGDELLEVVGIEARNGKSVIIYGYGQQVSACR